MTVMFDVSVVWLFCFDLNLIWMLCFDLLLLLGVFTCVGFCCIAVDFVGGCLN